jgi:hypothetical protein
MQAGCAIHDHHIVDVGIVTLVDLVEEMLDWVPIVEESALYELSMRVEKGAA